MVEYFCHVPYMFLLYTSPYTYKMFYFVYIFDLTITIYNLSFFRVDRLTI